MQSDISKRSRATSRIANIPKLLQMQCPKCRRMMHRKSASCKSCGTDMTKQKGYIDTRRTCQNCNARVGTRRLTCDCGADLGTSGVTTSKIQIPALRMNVPLHKRSLNRFDATIAKSLPEIDPNSPDAIDINSFLPGNWECASFKMHSKPHILASSPDHKDCKIESYPSIYEMLLAIFTIESKRKVPIQREEKTPAPFSVTLKDILPEAWKIARQNFAGKRIYVAMAIESSISYINYPESYLCDPDPAAVVHKIWIQEVDRKKRLDESKKERQESGIE